MQSTPGVPRTAMVLAAGLGVRMRPITLSLPKALVTVAGKALIDHSLDRLDAAGIDTAVVNMHHLADALERHLAGRSRPRIVLSDERELLLEAGGGVAKALTALGHGPFFVLNSDSLWVERGESNLARMAATWDAERMSGLLLLAPREGSIGYSGAGDFRMAADGRLARRGPTPAPFVYAGVAILDPGLFANSPRGPFSLNLIFDRALAAGRLFGSELAGQWLHVGTPEAIVEAERAAAAFAGRASLR